MTTIIITILINFINYINCDVLSHSQITISKIPMKMEYYQRNNQIFLFIFRLTNVYELLNIEVLTDIKDFGDI